MNTADVKAVITNNCSPEICHLSQPYRSSASLSLKSIDAHVGQQTLHTFRFDWVHTLDVHSKFIFAAFLIVSLCKTAIKWINMHLNTFWLAFVSCILLHSKIYTCIQQSSCLRAFNGSNLTCQVECFPNLKDFVHIPSWERENLWKRRLFQQKIWKIRWGFCLSQ